MFKPNEVLRSVFTENLKRDDFIISKTGHELNAQTIFARVEGFDPANNIVFLDCYEDFGKVHLYLQALPMNKNGLFFFESMSLTEKNIFLSSIQITRRDFGAANLAACRTKKLLSETKEAPSGFT